MDTASGSHSYREGDRVRVLIDDTWTTGIVAHTHEHPILELVTAQGSIQVHELLCQPIPRDLPRRIWVNRHNLDAEDLLCLISYRDPDGHGWVELIEAPPTPRDPVSTPSPLGLHKDNP